MVFKIVFVVLYIPQVFVFVRVFQVMSPRVNSGLFLLRPIFITLFSSSPNSMWYFPAIAFVILSIC